MTKSMAFFFRKPPLLCYSAAATILFRQIRVESSSIVSVPEDLKAWDKILITGNPICHVRELILKYPNDGKLHVFPSQLLYLYIYTETEI